MQSTCIFIIVRLVVASLAWHQFSILQLLNYKCQKINMSIKPTSGRKKVSIIWCYFDYDAVGDKSKCKICDKSLKGENTTNMISHLKQHPEAYVKFENEEKQRKELSSSTTANAATAFIADIAVQFQTKLAQVRHDNYALQLARFAETIEVKQ